MEVDWDVINEVAVSSGTDKRTASRVINLLNAGNTLPFIARYRKEATGNMDPDVLRVIKSKLTSCRSAIELFYQMLSCREVIDKVCQATKRLQTKGALTDDLKKSLKQCKTVDDVAMIVSFFYKSHS